MSNQVPQSLDASAVTTSERARVSILETLSKVATITSIVTIVSFQIGLHIDATPALRVLAVLVLAVGWLGARSALIHLLLLAAIPLAPAILRLATGREGPVLDLVWVAGLAALVVRNVSWSHWELPRTWRVLLGGWALLVSLAWPILAGREIGFDPWVLRDTAAINGWSLVTAPHAVHAILDAALFSLLGLLWFEWVFVRLAARPDRVPVPTHGLWIGTSAASLVAVYQGLVDPRFLSTPFWAELGRATGTMLDANAFGTAAAIAGPVAFLMIARIRVPQATRLASAVLALNLAGMWMSASRTALVCGSAGTLALVVSLWRARQPGMRRLWPVLALVCVATIGASLLVGAGTNPIRRLAVDLQTLAADAWSRGAYGPTAVRLFREYPLTGTGLASYYILGQDWSSEPLGLDNAQNWWRQHAAEFGLLGSVPIFIWSLLVAALVVVGRPPPESVLTATTLRAVLLGVGVVSLVGIPTQSPVVLLWFFVVVAWLATTLAGQRAVPVTTAHRSPSSMRHLRRGWAAVSLAAIAYAAGHLFLAFGSLDVAERAVRSQREYIVGTYEPEALGEVTQLRWTRDRARFVWPAATPWLTIDLLATNPDLAERPVEVTLATSCGVIFEESIRSTEPVRIGLELPDGLRAVDLRVRVSRTWRPTEYGKDDPRRLGIAVIRTFVNSRDEVLAQAHTLELAHCGAR
jgi:hypothetical protein